MDRRQFLKTMGIAGAATALPLKFNLMRGLKNSLGWNKAWAWSNSMALKKFSQNLRLFITDIPALTAWGTGPYGETVYCAEAAEFEDQLHPDLPNTTRLWGYGDQGGTHKHLGGVVATLRNAAVRIRMKNNLPPASPTRLINTIIPVDTSLYGANLGYNRIAVHLHGAFAPWISDGGPFDWYLPDGTGGLSFQNGVGSIFDNIPGLPMVAGEADYYYPNDQSARLMWYHDHVLGITRTNAYAGLATGYLIQDAWERNAVATGMLPPDQNRVIMVLQDKIFVTDQALLDGYGTYVPGAKTGDLWYPYIYDNAIWPPDPTTVLNPPIPSCIPEMFGDTMLVNGLVFPTLTVEQRKYRFLVLNACNARFVTLKLVKAASDIPTDFPNCAEPAGGYGANGSPTPPILGPTIYQIGTEGGFLPRTVALNGQSAATTLLLAPAERAEFFINFAHAQPGIYLLYNDAPAPFPTGDPRNDYYPGNPDAANFLTSPTQPGYGPNTRTIMQIVVKRRVGAANTTQPLVLPPMDPVPLRPVPAGTRVRRLTLNEDIDSFGRLAQTMGTNVAVTPPSFGRAYVDAPTEVVQQGAVEIWEIANLTGDTHPLHFHLVNCQITSRRPFDAANYNGKVTYTGPTKGADPNERGWKETVRMNPGEVTRVVMKFDLPATPFTVPFSDRLATYGINNGHEYVYHCHILEHEEHDMMRPLVVI